MKSVARARAVRRGIGQWLDDLELLDDRPRPAVRHDQRQSVVVLRAYVDEMDLLTLDLGQELRYCVEFRLALAPIVIGPPVLRQRLHHGQLDTLRVVLNQLTRRPSGRCDAPAQVCQIRIRIL